MGSSIDEQGCTFMMLETLFRTATEEEYSDLLERLNTAVREGYILQEDADTLQQDYPKVSLSKL